MRSIDLPASDYHLIGSAPLYPPTRRGLKKWLYFARHPILAVIMYQKAYPDEPEVGERRASVVLSAIGFYLARKFTMGGH